MDEEEEEVVEEEEEEEEEEAEGPFVGWVKCLVVESSSTLEKIKFNAADES